MTPTKDTPLFLVALAALVALANGCASYTVPGRAADLSLFMQGGEVDIVRETDDRPTEDLTLEEILLRKPMAAFPTGLAVVRVQAPDYASATYATPPVEGNYRVVTVRDLEEEEHLAALAKLPGVRGVAPFNRLLSPAHPEDDTDLRKVAAQLRADVLLIYTIDTSFVAEREIEPLDTITLGLLDTKKAEVHSTASAILMDTRTGYLYATAEGTADKELETSLWNTSRDVDRARRSTEQRAFAMLVDELTTTWGHVMATYGSARLPGH